MSKVVGYTEGMGHVHVSNKMEWGTFEGITSKLDEINHQHLSNIHYWTHLIQPNYTKGEKALICEQLDIRFDGQLLDYKPLRRFAKEMRILKNNGWLVNDKKSGKTLVVVDGEVIGEVDETTHS